MSTAHLISSLPPYRPLPLTSHPAKVMALRVTDAELKQEFLIPVGLAKTVGVFKDMVESANDRGQEPIILDETPEQVDLLVSWLFHDPDFEITKQNIGLLLQMAHKYEIPAMAKDICYRLRAADPHIITPEYAYVLGACFDVPMLEERHRQYVVQHFEKFLSLWKTKNYFNMLVQWCPQKIPLLVEDGFKHFKEESIKADGGPKRNKSTSFGERSATEQRSFDSLLPRGFWHSEIEL